MSTTLHKYGWNAQWQTAWNENQLHADLSPARVLADFGTSLQVVVADGLLSAETSGSLIHNSEKHAYPKVGDWVGVNIREATAVVTHVLPRKSQLTRRVAGKTNREQVMATNIDRAIIVQSMDHDLNINRLKRYLFQLQRSNIKALIVINKIDQDPSWRSKLEEIQVALPDQEIIGVQATDPRSAEQLASMIPSGETTVIVGSSGVGKSTIINTLLGEEKQTTQAVRRDDSKGRHTTTHREMFVLPNGALLIDTPGIRELQLWATEAEIEALDSQISSLAQGCKFSNCGHSNEPGCMVIAAISNGELAEKSLASFNTMKAELTRLNEKNSTESKQTQKKRQKILQKTYKKTTVSKKPDQE